MIGDGILDGDTLFVRQQETASRGDVVVFLIEGVGHRRTLRPGGRSHPAAAFEPQHGAAIYLRKTDFKRGQIAGIVVGVYRKMGEGTVTPISEVGPEEDAPRSIKETDGSRWHSSAERDEVQGAPGAQNRSVHGRK